MTDSKKRFVETSTARGMLLGSTDYQSYFIQKFEGDTLYISPFVRMEIMRSYVATVVDFYLFVASPNISSFTQAINIWSHMQGFQVKAGMILQAHLIEIAEHHDLKLSAPEHKHKLMTRLLILLKRHLRMIDILFVNTSTFTHCFRAKVHLPINLADPEPGLLKFVAEFRNVKKCRSECKVDKFILERYRKEVDVILGSVVNSRGQKNAAGFKRLATRAAHLIAKGPQSFTCRQCGSIGDLIIALEGTRHIPIEHTDYSFDYICPPIKQEHNRHDAERTRFKGQEPLAQGIDVEE